MQRPSGVLDQLPSATNYLRTLQNFGFQVTERGIWASVGQSARRQGWKLHVSSIPIEAMELLHTVLPCLASFRVPFKTAKSELILCQLNEGEFGGTQIGKFMTIYPSDDNQALAIASQLAAATARFHGPQIVTDLRLSEVAYARYGNFNPYIHRDRLGQLSLCILLADGSLQVDSYTVPFQVPLGILNPFEHMIDGAYTDSKQEPSEKLLGPGYLVLDVLKPHAKGSVFRAIDLRSQDLVDAKIIKQGRQYCLSDLHGRDMRSRLQKQERMHSALAGHSFIPKSDPYFEANDDGYLPIEFVDGVSIEEAVARTLKGQPWGWLRAQQKTTLLSYLEQLVVAVGTLHGLGIVHRDVTASNVWIGADNRLWLLDLELCFRIGDTEPPYGLGTPGFMSPQQASRMQPALEDDIYALGCIMVLVTTGLDPRRVLFSGSNSFRERLESLIVGPESFVDLIAQCLDEDSSKRPDAKTLLSCLQALRHDWETEPQSEARSLDGDGYTKDLKNTIPQFINSGIQGLVAGSVVDPGTGLWLSAAMDNSRHQAGPNSVGGMELRRSANRGVAGSVYVLGRLAQLGYTSERVADLALRACKWLLTDEPCPDLGLPGLHFGEAGVAVALAEAIRSGIISKDATVERFLYTALNGELDWPDITHGAAGQGVAAMYCGDILRDPQLLGLTHRCADYLINTQNANGSWTMPVGAPGMSGETLTGFAHGVAGMVYFLAEYGYRFQSLSATRAAAVGGQWLTEAAIASSDGSVLEWEYSDTNPSRWKWWCHGGPGISLAFLKLYERLGSLEYAEVAAKALRAHPRSVMYGNLSQCHGLSGLGEIYLEAATVLEDTEWLTRAEHIGWVLMRLCRRTDTGTAIWLVEDPTAPTPDLMVGSGGVIHFLMRLASPEHNIGFPLLI